MADENKCGKQRIALYYSQDPFLKQVAIDDLDGHSVVASDIAKLTGKNWDTDYVIKTRKDKSNPDSNACETFRNIAKTFFYSALNDASWRTVQQGLTKVGITLEDDIVQAAKEKVSELRP